VQVFRRPKRNVAQPADSTTGAARQGDIAPCSQRTASGCMGPVRGEKKKLYHYLPGVHVNTPDNEIVPAKNRLQEATK